MKPNKTRNQALDFAIQTYRDFLANAITPHQGFQMIILNELSPEEKYIYYFVKEWPDSSSRDITDYMDGNLVQISTTLKRLFDLNLMERKILTDQDGRHFVYQIKDLNTWSK